MVRPTFAEVSLSAVASNVAALKSLIEPAELCAVVKADAYGHGDAPVALAALDAGAASLAVALVEEGIRLREAGVSAPILLLSEPPLDATGEILEWELTPTVYSREFLERLSDCGERLSVELKVDTGMHRVGASPTYFRDLVEAVRVSRNLSLQSVWTHFAVADEDPVYTKRQIDLFDRVTSGLGVPTTHLANTAGAILFPEARRDLCRIGLGIYGLHPCEETKRHVDLRPAMRLISHVSHVQQLEAGERPSYGRRKALPGNSTVATVPIGYADGFARALSTQGTALIGGGRYPLAGTVTMDQIVVDVGDLDVEIGDEVVLLGEQSGAEIHADELASRLGTISYEIVCSVGPRVPRRYVN